jgi:hypothetical protein
MIHGELRNMYILKKCRETACNPCKNINKANEGILDKKKEK